MSASPIGVNRDAALAGGGDRLRLDAAMTALSLFIRDLCAEPRLGISLARCGDREAHIWVSLPSILGADERERLANRMAAKGLAILLAEGFLIGASI